MPRSRGRPAIERRFGAVGLVGRSRVIARISDQVLHLAPTRVTVLIEGEPGAGKTRVARAIHESSPRRAAPFVVVRLGDLEPDQIEPELFGSEASGAETRPGRLELADRGTVYIAQIERAPAPVQLRLLRAFQDRAIERVGGRESIKLDLRVVASTEVELAVVARGGRFRDDLFQRLAAVRITVSPLRERREDIPLLVESFLEELGREHGRRVTEITAGALERLMENPWPGNVRQLRQTIEDMVMLARRRRTLDMTDLPPSLRPGREPVAISGLAVGMTVEEAERRLVELTMRHTGGDKPRAAAMLGIGLRTLYRKLERYRLG